MPKLWEGISRETLRCKLNDAEMIEYGKKLAESTRSLVQLEAQKKQVVDQLKAEASRHEADISLYASRVGDGFELRQIECKWELDTSTNPPKFKFLVRSDTGDTVRTSALSAEEIEDLNQLQLPLEAEQADA
jgi:hypothetical protein